MSEAKQEKPCVTNEVNNVLMGGTEEPKLFPKQLEHKQ